MINISNRMVRGGRPGGGGFNLASLAKLFGNQGGGGNYTPPPMVDFNTSVQANPQLEALQGEMADFGKELSAGNDRDAINALQRQRDLSSGMAKEFQSMAGARGAGPDSGASALMLRRGFDEAGRNMSGLNANLASDARRQRSNLLGMRSGHALGTAGHQLGQQNFGLAQWQANQGNMLAHAQLQAMQQNNMWGQMMDLAKFFSG